MDTKIAQKIKSINELASVIADNKGMGNVVVLCHGVFDVLHPGHIRHLEVAKREGDVLVVTITPDRYVNKGPGRPVFTQELRAEVLANLAVVDFVAINEWPTAVETIKKLKPNRYVKGNDYKEGEKDITGGIAREKAALDEVGGEIVFTNEITFSSSSLANKTMDVFPKQTVSFLNEFRVRHSEEDLLNTIEKTKGCRALVIGDTIIDQYRYVTPMGKSPKENVIVTKYLSEETFAGGVLAAANHVASLCDQVDLVTCLGEENTYEDFSRKHLKDNVNAKFFYRDDAPTVLKRRFVEPNYTRKLFEMVYINGDYLPESTEQKVLNHLESHLSEYDLVLVTDFGHGMITPKVISLLCEKSKFLSINVQTNSANTGYNLVTKYPRADYVCIDEPEARLALHDRVSPIEKIIRQLGQRLEAQHVTITRGNHGCIVHTPKDDSIYKIPVMTARVVDTVGAGDAFLSISSPCVAMGAPIEQVGFVGNAAGAIKVQIVGNRSSVERVPLMKFITTLMK